MDGKQRKPDLKVVSDTVPVLKGGLLERIAHALDVPLSTFNETAKPPASSEGQRTELLELINCLTSQDRQRLLELARFLKTCARR